MEIWGTLEEPLERTVSLWDYFNVHLSLNNLLTSIPIPLWTFLIPPLITKWRRVGALHLEYLGKYFKAAEKIIPEWLETTNLLYLRGLKDESEVPFSVMKMKVRLSSFWRLWKACFLPQLRSPSFYSTFKAIQGRSEPGCALPPLLFLWEPIKTLRSVWLVQHNLISRSPH